MMKNLPKQRRDCFLRLLVRSENGTGVKADAQSGSARQQRLTSAIK